MTSQLQYGTLRHDADLDAAVRNGSIAFFGPPEGMRTYLDSVGRENIRAVHDGDRLAAMLVIRPFGQFFGGRSVPMAGIASVASTPESRGSGAGTFLMQRCMRDLFESGWHLSTLYPATRALYRRAGYESAGARYTMKLSLREIERDRTAERAHARFQTVPLSPTDDAPARTLYASIAPEHNGHLDRSDWAWSRIHSRRGTPASGFAFVRDGRCEAYAFIIAANTGNDLQHDVTLTDACAASLDGARRVLAFLSDFRTTATGAQWAGAPDSILTAAMNEQHTKATEELPWMVRIVNVERALNARGWPAHVAAAVRLRVRDELIPENAGPWLLDIRAGRAEVSRAPASSPAPELSLDVRALAPLYTGYRTPRLLARLGLLQGDDAAISAAESIFAGPMPWMPDFF